MNAYIVLWNVRNKSNLSNYLRKRKMIKALDDYKKINFTHWNVLYDLVLSIHSLDFLTTHNDTKLS